MRRRIYRAVLGLFICAMAIYSLVKAVSAQRGEMGLQVKSGGSGAFQEDLNITVLGERIYGVAKGAPGSDVIYAATRKGLFVSGDGGQAWRELLLPSVTKEVFSVAVNPSNYSTLLAGTREGLWMSEDEGASWRQQSSFLPARVVPLKLVTGEITPGLTYMGTARHGIFRSLDGGYTWEDISRGLPPGIGASEFGSLSTVAVSPKDDFLLLVGTELGEIYRSPDGGATWKPAKGIPEPATRRTYFPVVTFNASVPETVYAIVSRPVHSHRITNTLYKSIDAGARSRYQ